MVPRVKYLQVQDILGIQRNAILKKIKDKSTEHINFPGLRMPMGKSGKRSIDPLEVPGIPESGWTPEMDMMYGIVFKKTLFFKNIFLFFFL